MIFRSNLTAPDLDYKFRMKNPALTMNGHAVPSDPQYEPGCGFMTHDEAAILYHIAKRKPGTWVDIGSRLGWTAAHIIAAGEGKGNTVYSVDPAYQVEEFAALAQSQCPEMIMQATTSHHFLNGTHYEDFFDGFVIDGDHDFPTPMLDAIAADKRAKPDAVIVLHDFMGRPIQDAVVYLMAMGWNCRIYDTPNGMACCWRGEGFKPPHHVPDNRIAWDSIRRQMAIAGFPYERCL